MPEKRRIKISASGQAALEYLLTLAAVFIAFAGTSILFSNQINRYLALLFGILQLPF
jgi:hypothetical protein